MDDLTHAFYDTYAQRLRTHPEAPRSAMMALAERFFRPGDVVLDVGAGSGRDTAALRALGIQAFGVERNAPMRALALATHPELEGCIRDAGLPALHRPFEDLHPQGFDGVVCSAVLMHIGPEDLVEALAGLAALLKPTAQGQDGSSGSSDSSTPRDSRGSAGVLLLSLPEMSPDRLQHHRDPDGRLFFNHPPSQVMHTLQQHRMTLAAHEISDAVLTTSGTRWHSLAFIQA
ncbi:class I SAM-dependent methyltransferase [Roseateles depolymerans]|uniref:Uncharacterized protein n=1 Tax=Roseateles depolymerans TaxID=76731 RepID=A0A0U3MXZ9_9BURK|nr:class I SAM-dependent methyltransferase [Roseateles depolymerans]ALV07875.1 hypothetical protein RD2015_3418 [Roseateles depolymerans]REG21904.1 methyltransferase family protein [Roseateles depolymerans]